VTWATLLGVQLGDVVTDSDGRTWIAWRLHSVRRDGGVLVARQWSLAAVPDGETIATMGRAWRPDDQQARIVTEPLTRRPN